MKYLIYNTKQEALNRSHEIAVMLGSGGGDDVTQYWFAVVENSDTGQAAMEVENEGLLQPAEIAELKDEQYMIDNGWFKIID